MKARPRRLASVDRPSGVARSLRVLKPTTWRRVYIPGDGAGCPPYSRPSEDQEEVAELILLAGQNNCQDDPPSDGEADAVRAVVPESKRHVHYGATSAAQPT
jgi:hypothetical protein